MKGAKQILLAGFAALCMFLPACRSTTSTFIENVKAPELVVSAAPLNSVSYTAEYAQAGALPFTCEVKLASGSRIRRDYVWKDEKGAEKRVTIVIDGTAAFRSEDTTSSLLGESDVARTSFFAGLVLDFDSVVAGARQKKDPVEFSVLGGKSCRAFAMELAGIPGIESCLAATDPETDRWLALFVRMTDEPNTAFRTEFQDYKTESGVTYPSRIVTTTEDGAPVTCAIRDVKINPELPDELFKLSEPNG